MTLIGHHAEEIMGGEHPRATARRGLWFAFEKFLQSIDPHDMKVEVRVHFATRHVLFEIHQHEDKDPWPKDSQLP